MANDLKLSYIAPLMDNTVVEAKYVKGGYFTVSDYATLTGYTGSIETGSLCYVRGTDTTYNKPAGYYKYNGTTWIEEDFGGGSSDLIKYGTEKEKAEDVTETASSVKIWTDTSGNLHIDIA